MNRRRFGEFTADEIFTLWEGLIYDDGIPYDPEPGTPEHSLVAELEAEWRTRLPAGWGVSLTEVHRRGLANTSHSKPQNPSNQAD